jgi:uncharacterized BrkB/YihY/UPF0761 family membrane protein
MKSPKTLSVITIILGIIALVGLYFSRMAVRRIYQGNDPNLTLEWTIIRLSFVFSAAFVIMTLVTIWRWRKNVRLPEN